MATLITNLTTFAFISRLAIIITQIISNSLIPDHDAHVFNPQLQLINSTIFDSFLQFCFGGLRRWDAVYFTHIAEYGYTYENCVAFFPCYPFLVSLFSKVVSMIGVIQMSQCVLLTGVLINCILFSLTARNLYILSKETGLDEITSLLSAFVFCINPASIFMTAPYSEILYFYSLILSLLYIKRGFIFRASVMIAVSISVRSNGLVGIGFILYSILQNFIKEFYPGVRLSVNRKFAFLVLSSSIKVIVCLIICLSTFFLYQYYIYTLFCTSSHSMPNSAVIAYGREQGYKVVGDSPSSWCFQKLPISYSHIQAKHWGVGFFNYYQVKQIPNFVLASPVVLMSLFACVFFFKTNPEVFLTLGLFRRNGKKNRKRMDGDANLGQDNDSCRDEKSHLAEQMVVYVIHLSFLTLFGCCFIHIQVLTRLLFSSSPLLYWYAGVMLTKEPLISSYIKSLISVLDTMHAKDDQNVFGNIVARRHLAAKKESFASSNGHETWFHWFDYFCQHYLMSNIGVKILVFMLKNWSRLNLESKFIFIYCIGYMFIGTVMFSNFLPWT